MRFRKILVSVPVICLLYVNVHAQEGTTMPGKKLFVQRCSVCHLPPLGARRQNSYARSLNGYLKGTESEARAREVIRKGTAGMPGFQYTFEPEQIESIITYLNTLK